MLSPNKKFLRGGPGGAGVRRTHPIRGGIVSEYVFHFFTCTCNLHLSPLAESAPPGRRRQKNCISALLLLILVMVPSSFAQMDDVKHYLLMQEIPEAFKNVALFKPISAAKISVNLDSPFNLHGYLPIDKFIDDFTLRFSGFEILDIDWVSRQLEEQFAVQSLALILKNMRSEKTVYYKLIFFLAKKDKKWKIYYLRGLKIRI
jgi:hypothetical protein